MQKVMKGCDSATVSWTNDLFEQLFENAKRIVLGFVLREER